MEDEKLTMTTPEIVALAEGKALRKVIERTRAEIAASFSGRRYKAALRARALEGRG